MNGLFFKGSLEQNFFGHILAEIYKDGVYEPFLRGKKDLTILDLGANVGIFSYYASQFAKTVYAVEPSEEHFDTLKYQLDYNKLAQVKPFKFAVSGKDGQTDFYNYGNKTMNSLYGNIQGVPQTKVEKVDLKRLDTFFKEQKIEHIDFCKMDIEGVEFEVLGSESFTNVAPKIDALVVELHSWANRNFNQAIDALKIRGYKVHQIPAEATIIAAIR